MTNCQETSGAGRIYGNRDEPRTPRLERVVVTI